MDLPQVAEPLIGAFSIAFSQPTFQRVLVLILGPSCPCGNARSLACSERRAVWPRDTGATITACCRCASGPTGRWDGSWPA